MNVTIRTAAMADAPAVNEVYRYYIANSVATFGEICKTDDERAQEICTLLKRYPYLIAEDENGAFLGFACAEPIRMQSGYRFAAELTIYLHPDTPKGAGVGTQLYNRLFTLLQKQGFTYAVAIVHAGNEASIGLHRHFGFTQAARFDRCAYKLGRWLDAVVLVKQFMPLQDPPPEPIPFPMLAE